MRLDPAESELRALLDDLKSDREIKTSLLPLHVGGMENAHLQVNQ